ncbi:MAG TPA: DUF1624 domain-containing protein [Candidatus Stercoripulliclostridium merdipullorum]|uniref:DUF1624 domain-containing protein n=1 Tax=Candidatus Stercoripulliclostridium merdipullorum TaxID=2840952 RepID=A0A9D1SXM7_9FIRM|nr:DUF1624 domain-containing protein [Candidatus Stercoripulliclostridium merdipullorum]
MPKIPTKKTVRNRAWEIDALRGIAILLVVFDHLMYDCAVLFGEAWYASGNQALIALSDFAYDFLTSDLKIYGWIVFVFLFFFLSGIATAFSRNNLNRGLRLAAVALALSAVTYGISCIPGFEGTFIRFGVLHCIALNILIYALLRLIVDRLPFAARRIALVLVPLTVAGAAIGVHLVLNVPILEVAKNSFAIQTDNPALGILVYCENWYSADYFPLLPYAVPFFAGATVAPLVYPRRKSLLPALDRAWHRPLSFAGRHSLWFYLGGQVVGIGIFALITLAVTGSPF